MAAEFKPCSIDGCNRNAHRSANGRGLLCRFHHYKKMRYGDPLGEPSKRTSNRKSCKIDGCGKPVHGNGLCGSHYNRKYRHGDPLAGRANDGEPLAWIERHKSYAGNDCLCWPFSKRDSGYADVIFRGRRTVASRVMCILAHGEPKSKRLDAAHSCGHRWCMTPAHLRWATRSENNWDKLFHGKDNRGEKHYFAKLTEDQVRQIRSLRGKVKQRDLAELFLTSRENVSSIQRRKSWRHI